MELLCYYPTFAFLRWAILVQDGDALTRSLSDTYAFEEIQCAQMQLCQRKWFQFRTQEQSEG
jgi:hypothetical protein